MKLKVEIMNGTWFEIEKHTQTGRTSNRGNGAAPQPNGGSGRFSERVS